DGAHRDVLEAVDATLAPQTIAVALHRREHLVGQHRAGRAHVAGHPRRLDLEEDVGRGLAEAPRVEGRVHLPDVRDALVEIGRRGGGPPAGPPRAPGVSGSKESAKSAGRPLRSTSISPSPPRSPWPSPPNSMLPMRPPIRR